MRLGQEQLRGKGFDQGPFLLKTDTYLPVFSNFASAPAFAARQNWTASALDRLTLWLATTTPIGIHVVDK